MLRELKDVLKEGEPYRRVFEDSFFDLFVWYDSPLCTEIVGFQLAYGSEAGERALTWYKDKGFNHEKVDDPVFIGPKMTPILLPDGIFKSKDVIALFQNSAQEIEVGLRDFIVGKMREFDSEQTHAKE